LAFVAVACVEACQKKASGSSTLTTTVAGRKIQAVIDGPGFIHPEDNGATVSFPSHKVVVETERVLLDGAEVSQIPADAKEVDINVKAGVLTVSADGKAMATKPIDK